MRIGDIVLLSYETKSKADSYRLGVVVEFKLEEDSLVHTVHVTYSMLRELPKAKRAELKGITKKTICVPVQRLVLIVVEEQDGGVYGTAPSDAKDEANEDRKRIAITTTGRLPPSGAEGDNKRKGPGFPVHSTKVLETTLMVASVTYKQSVSHETNNKDLKTNDFKVSLTKTYNAERPDQPLQLAYENESFETQGVVAAGIFMRQSSSIGSRGLRGEGHRMYGTTQDHVNVDLKPATVNMVHDESLGLICSLVSNEDFVPVLTGLRPGLHASETPARTDQERKGNTPRRDAARPPERSESLQPS